MHRMYPFDLIVAEVLRNTAQCFCSTVPQVVATNLILNTYVRR